MGKGYRLALVVFYCCLVKFGSATDTSLSDQPINQTYVEKLKNDLLLHYDRDIRPSQQYNVTNVNVRLTIRHVEIDEERSVFSLSGWIKMDWIDQKLRWRPSDYGGVESFRLTSLKVWKPDIMLYNNANGADNVHYGETNVIIYNNGKILWVPPSDFHSFCRLNLLTWPFDTQTCFLKLGSWTFDGYKINITSEEDPELELSVANNQWSVLKATTQRNVKYYSCCTEPYVDITFNVTMKRESATHKAIVISPAIVIMLLSLSVFWLPPNCGEKILLNGVIAIIVTIYLVYFAQLLPVMSGHTPLIVTFFSNVLYLTGISTIIAIITLRFSRIKHAQPVPTVIKNQLDGFLGSICCVRSGGSLDDDKEAAVNGRSDPKQQEWVRLATLLDRLVFIIYLIVFIIAIWH